ARKPASPGPAEKTIESPERHVLGVRPETGQMGQAGLGHTDDLGGIGLPQAPAGLVAVAGFQPTNPVGHGAGGRHWRYLPHPGMHTRPAPTIEGIARLQGAGKLFFFAKSHFFARGARRVETINLPGDGEATPSWWQGSAQETSGYSLTNDEGE